MAPIRVLIVDDSVVVRKVLCEALSVDATIQVAGTAADGHIALARIQQLSTNVQNLASSAKATTDLRSEIRWGAWSCSPDLLADATAHLPETRQWVTHCKQGCAPFQPP